jgi:hypothetical protein
MSNTSATGGVLSAAAPLPIDDVALDAVFQSLVASVTGLDGTLVRPRWQPEVPKQPEPHINWCAIGILEVDQDDGPWLIYDEPSNTELYWDHESIELLASFYGPNAQQYARLLRAGLNVPQNTEALLPYAIRYVSCGPIRPTPELLSQQWIKRQDISLSFRRKVEMIFDVQNILIAEVNLRDDTVVNDTIIVPPGSIVEP